MKRLLAVALALFASQLTGCSLLGIELCPADQDLGTLKLVRPRFSVYRGDETLTFANLANEKRVLGNYSYPVPSGSQKLVLTTPCNKSVFIKQEVYYNVPYTFVLFRENKAQYLTSQIYYSFGIEDMRIDQSTNDTLFAETLTVNNGYRLPNTRLRVLIADRGRNSARFSPARLADLLNYRIIADTLLGGQRYKQVYCVKESPTLFFAYPEGIVAFKDEQEWWYRVP
jgi:hypothetical protein